MDLLEQTLYLQQEAGTGLRIVERYLDAVLTTCEVLAERPFAGRPFSTKAPRLRELRRFPVSRPFEKHLIFYKPTAVGIDVVRVLHGARDIDAILADEEPEK